MFFLGVKRFNMTPKIKIHFEKELSEDDRTAIEQEVILLLNKRTINYIGNVAFNWKKGKEKYEK